MALCQEVEFIKFMLGHSACFLVVPCAAAGKRLTARSIP